MARRALVALALLTVTLACSSRSEPPLVQETAAPSLTTPPAKDGGSPASPSASAPVSATPATPASTAPAPAQTAAPTAAPDLAAVQVRLEPFVELAAPTALAVRPGDDGLYVAERAGRVRVLREGAAAALVLDLSERTTTDGERGLLGLAFARDGATLYVSYTDTAGDNRLDAYPVAPDGSVDPATRREILAVEQYRSNHNGGHIAFGPDGFLYVGIGDGGGGGDPLEAAQDLSTLLGKLLRIDPNPSGGYEVPADNPFVGRDGARSEIWAYGLRNPWRFSFDRATGQLWIGDVGQNRREEIDLAPGATGAGANYGWDALEGTLPFEGDPPPDAVAPVYEYPRADGRCAVTGGFVYRGEAIPALRGAYVFADFCVGRIHALAVQDGRVTDERDLGVRMDALVSFAEDAAGELYVLSLGGQISRIVDGS
jgi:glucose/arabinose dehydrogenase